MSELDNCQVDELEAHALPDGLETLKARAKQLGIKFHPSIGVESLREKVNAKLTGKEDPVEEVVESADEVETVNQKRKRLRSEAGKLLRVIVTPLSTLKREWPGEYHAAGNSIVGTYRRYVPYNNETGWHVEAIIVEQLKNAQCQEFKTVIDSRGNKSRKGYLKPAYTVTVLPQLSPKELADLAQRQAMANGTGE